MTAQVFHNMAQPPWIHAFILSAVLALSLNTSHATQNQTLELHGSGTTNPSKFFWKVMDQMEVHARLPIMMTYRAVGSGTGMTEFVGNTANGFQAYSHFGSGDVPMSQDKFEELEKNAGPDQMIHVPFALGAIALFHSVPFDGLQLDACLLSKIFQRKITTWDHADIKAMNPELQVPQGTSIKVVHRVSGSSSTAGLTQYLKTSNDDSSDISCFWDLDTGTTTSWPEGTMPAEPDGSDGVAETIQKNEYAIGYLDSGHGHRMGFKEVALKNKDDRYLVSSAADISAAGNMMGDLPNATADWSGVNLYNKPGPDTWPITMMSYFYIRKDLTALAESGSLLKAFVEYVLSEEGQEEMTAFGFSKVPSTLLDYNNETLRSLILHPDAPAWTYELSSTKAISGMGAYTLSQKRSTYAEYERGLINDQLASLQTGMSSLDDRAAHSLHGSGTTNPSKYFWKLMDIMEERARVPLFMTYRAVGSGTGMKEAAGNEANAWQAFNHFGSGDIPMTEDLHTSVNGAGGEVLHVPFALGAISFFHSIPVSAQPEGGVHLTACLLSQIFQRKIRTWDHEDILAVNPDLKVPAGSPIKVVHRVSGSSSTAGATEYLKTANAQASQACQWELLTGGTITWPSDTFEGLGSDGVAGFLQDNEFSIGYLDAGHGQALSLSEIALQNADGEYLRSDSADIGAAATEALKANILPAEAAASWHNVNLYNQPGAATWPITMMSYFYIRKDLTALGASGTLLKAFIGYVLSEDGQNMATEFQFSKLPPSILEYNADTLNNVVVSQSAPAWVFEEGDESPDVYGGAGNFVLSGKRRSFADYDRERMQAAIDELTSQVAALRATPAPAPAQVHVESDSDDDNAEALGIAALALALIALLLSLFNTYTNCSSSNVGACATPGTTHLKMDDDQTAV